MAIRCVDPIEQAAHPSADANALNRLSGPALVLVGFESSGPPVAPTA